MYEKVGISRQVTIQEVTAKEPSMRCRNCRKGVKTGILPSYRDKSRRNLLTAWVASGTEMARLVWRLYMEHGNLSSDAKGEIQAVPLQESAYQSWHRDGLARSNEEAPVMGVE
jgi:hypothetical protein